MSEWWRSMCLYDTHAKQHSIGKRDMQKIKNLKKKHKDTEINALFCATKYSPYFVALVHTLKLFTQGVYYIDRICLKRLCRSSRKIQQNQCVVSDGNSIRWFYYEMQWKSNCHLSFYSLDLLS